MKVESVYDIILDLDEDQRKELFKLLKKPLPKVEYTPWIRSWKGLSEYIDEMPSSTLKDLYKDGLFEMYKLGKTAVFKRSEIDAAIKKVER